MITPADFYSVMAATVPLYVAMLLAYASVRWWKILTPDQCSGINRFVAIFAVPLLSFQIIARNNPYDMSLKFVLADALQKLVVLSILGAWTRYSRRGSFDWMITLFMLATLPNTLVMGIPLLNAMYGSGPGGIVVQAVVLQCIVWYTLLLFMFEYRSAKLLIAQKFPDTAASIASVKADPDVVSLSFKEGLTTEASVGEDGKIYVQVKRSPPPPVAKVPFFSPVAERTLASTGFSSKASTPGASDLSNAEIYSVHSSSVLTPGHSERSDFYLMMSGSRSSSPFRLHEVDSAFQSSNQSSNVHTPREAVISGLCFKDEHIFPLDMYRNGGGGGGGGRGTPNFDDHFRHLVGNQSFSQTAMQITKKKDTSNDEDASSNLDYDAKELQMFVWSASTSPRSPASMAAPAKLLWRKDEKVLMSHETTLEVLEDPVTGLDGSGAAAVQVPAERKRPWIQTFLSSNEAAKLPDDPDMPSTAVMTKLILDMVWRKLVRNPNTYSSLLGLSWALVSFRWNLRMPKIIEGSITILSDAGLGMAMFSLGLFMALQPKLLACGTSMTIIGMVIRFVTSPATMAATSIAAGLHGLDLRASIVQAALPQGIVPFVFAKEYNVHPDVLSTAVIFGMLVSLPITLLYYTLLGLS